MIEPPRQVLENALGLLGGRRQLARKPGALRNGAPFKDWVLSAAMERVRRKLAGADDGNRPCCPKAITNAREGEPQGPSCHVF